MPTVAEVCGKPGSHRARAAEAVELVAVVVGAELERAQGVAALEVEEGADSERVGPAPVVLEAREARAEERVRVLEAVQELERDQAVASRANG